MAQFTKEILEIPKADHPGSSAPPANLPKQASGHLRSDALSLEIPVKVHGSRVTEVVRQVTPHTEPFEEETSTMIVFPQGAVVRMATAVSAGQMLVLTNLKSRQDAICRVVKVRTFSKMQGYVEIEFTHSQPGYWGVHFPSDAPASNSAPPASAPAPAPNSTSSSAPAVDPSAPLVLAEATNQEASKDVTPPPPRFASPPPIAASVVQATPEEKKPAAAVQQPSARPAQPESAFISIGSQEKVQPAAAPTWRAVDRVRNESQPEAATKSPVIDFPAAPPAKPVPSLSMAELLGDEVAHAPAAAATADHAVEPLTENAPAESESPASRSFGTFGSLTGGTSLAAGHSSPSDDFGARLDLSLGSSTDPAPRQRNWLLVAACIALACAVVIAGVVYVRQHLGARTPSARSATVASEPPQVIPGTSVAQTPTPVATTVEPAKPAPIAISPKESSSAAAPESAPPLSKVPPTVAEKPAIPATPAKQPASAVTSDMVAATLNAHPIGTQRLGESTTEAAPALDTKEISGSPEPAIDTSAHVPTLAAPVVVPAGPVRVGGNIKEPRLLSYRPPDYPMVAKQAHVEGDVVIDTQIDKSGRVANMKVVSGPPMLRDAALNALRAWKYEPSTLDGEPVSIQMLVTIKFRL
jgi:TonB family protein